MIDPAVDSLDNVLHLKHNTEVVSNEEGKELVGNESREKFKLIICDVNIHTKDTVRELVVPLAKHLTPGGVLVVTLKLSWRVEGLAVKVESSHKLLVDGGLAEADTVPIHKFEF